MPDRRRQRRSPARFLAPLALLAVIAGIYLIVHNALERTKHPVHTTSTVQRPQQPSHTTAHGHTHVPATTVRYYVVRPGDDFEVIAARTGVSLKTIETLNPGVSSTALHVGQRLTLHR
jgi:LysM repeat protein